MKGYLITPRLLIDPKVLPPYSVESASVYEANAPLLRLNSAPTAAHLVDDVWSVFSSSNPNAIN